MLRIFKRFIVIIFLCSAHEGFALTSDSVKVKVPTILHYTTPETGVGGMLSFFSLDTTLYDLEIFNQVIKYFFNDLGNIGSAADPQLFSLSSNLLTQFGNRSFSLYQWDPSHIRYYKTNKRFSNLDYHMSGGKEQQITITFAQNILSNWNAGIDFNRQGSLGFLNNGKTFITNFDFFTWYHLPNNRYHLFASGNWNSIKNEANGGLTDDSLFNGNNFSNNDLKGLKIGLIDAEQHVRNHIFSLTHFYELITRKDTAGKSIPFIRLEHHSEYERYSYDYNDNLSDSSYYRNNYFSNDIKDSLHYDQWTNTVTLSSFYRFTQFHPVHQAVLDITGGNQWFDFEQLYDTTLNNYFAEARLRTASLRNRTTLDVSGRYILSGANEKDYLFKAEIRFPLLFGADMHVGLQEARQSPGLSQNFYLSDHFVWENNFDKITSRQFFAGINLERFHFAVGGTRTFFGRYIYYNTLALPVQSQDTLQVSTLFVQKDFHVWKIWFKNSLWFQSTNSDVVRIPRLASHHSLFYEDRFFKDKLSTQIGFDVHYTSSYYSNAYSPATSVFFMQNEEKTNGYALVDFFVNFKIKTARLFVKIQNIGDNIVADHYMTTLHYPMPGLVIQFGLNWRFYD